MPAPIHESPCKHEGLVFRGWIGLGLFLGYCFLLVGMGRGLLLFLFIIGRDWELKHLRDVLLSSITPLL
jgi:hypothetical protein